MPENIIDSILEWNKEQQKKRDEMIRKLLETEPGQNFLRGADNFFVGTRALNNLGRAAPDLFSRALSNVELPRFVSDPGEDEGLEGLMKFFNPFDFRLKDIGPVQPWRHYGDVPIPTPEPTPEGVIPRSLLMQGATPNIRVQGQPHGGGIPEGSSILFAAGAGRNEKEGKIKDMERDLAVNDKLQKLMERIRGLQEGHNVPKDSIRQRSSNRDKPIIK